MSWSNPNSPNIGDFMLFLQDSMEIPPSAIPASNTWPQYALNRALNLVLSIPTVSALEYTLAVYNCAGHIFLRITPDNPNICYLKEVRAQFALLKFVAGVIESTSDESTSSSAAVPEGLRNLTVGDLNFILTPWGREYLSFQQDFGDIAGLS